MCFLRLFWEGHSQLFCLLRKMGNRKKENMLNFEVLYVLFSFLEDFPIVVMTVKVQVKWVAFFTFKKAVGNIV